MGTPSPRRCSRVARPSLSEARESGSESSHPQPDIPDLMDVRVYAARLHWSTTRCLETSVLYRATTFKEAERRTCLWGSTSDGFRGC